MKARLATLALMIGAVLSLHAQPKVDIVGGTKLDFGDIHRGQKVEHKVLVRNTGNQTLELGKVDVSCGCTGTVVTNSSISPGKTGEVLITFNSTNFSGKIHKSITINSNAPGGPAVVEFEGNVIQEIVTDPQQFWLKDAEVGRTTWAKITLKNNGAEPLSLTSYTTTLEGFKLILPKEPIKPGSSVELSAEFKGKTPTQVLNDNVAIKTSSKNEPEINVRIFGAVKEFKFQ